MEPDVGKLYDKIDELQQRAVAQVKEAYEVSYQRITKITNFRPYQTLVESIMFLSMFAFGLRLISLLV